MKKNNLVLMVLLLIVTLIGVLFIHNKNDQITSLQVKISQLESECNLRFADELATTRETNEEKDQMISRLKSEIKTLGDELISLNVEDKRVAENIENQIRLNDEKFWSDIKKDLGLAQGERIKNQHLLKVPGSDSYIVYGKKDDYMNVFGEFYFAEVSDHENDGLNKHRSYIDYTEYNGYEVMYIVFQGIQYIYRNVNGEWYVQRVFSDEFSGLEFGKEFWQPVKDINNLTEFLAFVEELKVSEEVLDINSEYKSSILDETKNSDYFFENILRLRIFDSKILETTTTVYYEIESIDTYEDRVEMNYIERIIWGDLAPEDGLKNRKKKLIIYSDSVNFMGRKYIKDIVK